MQKLLDAILSLTMKNMTIKYSKLLKIISSIFPLLCYEMTLIKNTICKFSLND